VVVGTIDFFLLGPLEARQRERPLRLGSIKHRMLLAKLLLHPNQVVSTEELIEAVWGEEPPPTVKQSLQNHVAALRKSLEAGNGSGPPRTLLTRDPGYLLRVDPERLDLHRFQRLDREGRQALAEGDPARAADLLRQALALWRGPALADVAASADIAWPELVGVEELQVASTEARIEAELALGRHHELVAELEALVRLYPLREHLHGQLMLALYRSGRQADALAAYRAARKVLVDELGIEPSVGLQRLEQAILAQDPALDLLVPARSGQPEADGGHPAAEPGAGPAGDGGGSVERKLVSVLFAEVDEPLGEAGERDPEDVSSMLDRHLDRVRAEIESFGGTVEHAIGGITMATFGVPQTREDDPERAVRAALAIRDALSSGGSGGLKPSPPVNRGSGGLKPSPPEDGGSGGLKERSGSPPEDRGVELRLAVTTGEALVTDGVRVTGEPVATCARLQQAAPPGTVLVSEATGRATERSISYGPASLLALAGRARPMTVWSALEPRNRTGMDALAAGPVPLIGRDRELGTLLEAFRRAKAERRPGMVTLLGPPGIGKSRLVAELGRALDADSDLVTWRQGRSSPWDEGRTSPAGGVTYWGLAEIVKAEAGILENDTPDRVGRRLSRVVAHAMAEDPAAIPWVTGHLRSLVGEDGDAPAQPGRREEAYTAWRRFLYGLAARRPLVLVLEDLHRADDALLDFLQELVEPATLPSLDPSGRPLRARSSPPAPLLLVATARPELLERRQGWGGTAGAGVAVELEPLSEADTGHLLETLLSHHRLPSTVGPALLAATGGNPLFSEEYVRMVRDRLPADAPSRERLPLPETVHAIIAARLDALPAEEKAALQDLAVLGRVGWVGALGAVSGRDPNEVEAYLQRLAAKEFLYRAGRSSMAGEREYGFRHVLVCEIAYGQIPRLERAGKHRRAAAWLESLAAERSELRAHHYRRALELASAAGQDVGELAGRARLALRDAGDRVSGLGAHVTAARYYTEALDIWPAGDTDRPELELRAGEARYLGEGAGEELLIRARDGLLAKGDRERAAEAEIRLGQLAYARGQERSPHLERALALVAGAPASRTTAVVLSGCATLLLVSDQYPDALQVARDALAMARTFRDREAEVAALGTIGAARVSLGDPGGVADLERCIALCDAEGSSSVIPWRNNLAFSHSILGDLRRCFAARERAWEAAERFGSARGLRWLELERTAESYWSGRWDQAVRIADSVTAQASGGATHYMESECRLWRGRIRLARGQPGTALEDARRALAQARESGDRLNVDPALAFAARALLAAGRDAEAAKLLDELLATLGGGLLKPELGVDLAVAMVELGRPVEALDGVLPSRWLEAARAFVAGDPGRAARTYAEIGSRPDEAAARLATARRLLPARPVDGRAELERAIAFFREAGATASLEQAKELLFALA
jgi:DNA-binding SARP family transcriptional activator/class 3 adenylate cyclase